MFAELYEELYTSTTKTHEHEHEDTYEQHEHTMKPFTMQELNDAINLLKRGKTADTRAVNAENNQTLHKQTQKHTRCDCTTRSSNRTNSHRQTGGTRRSKLHTKVETQHHHRTTGPFVRSPTCANSAASSLDANRSADSAGVPTSQKESLRVASHPGAQPSISKKHATQWSTVAYIYSQSSTINNEQQYTPTPEGNQFHLERGPTQHTLVEHSLLQYTMEPPSEKWNRDNFGVRVAEHDRDANFCNHRFAHDILLILHTACNYTPRKRKSSPT